MLGKRKDSFIEEAGSPGEKTDSCPKGPSPHSLGFAQRFYREKRKGLRAGERHVGAWSAHGPSSDWLVVRSLGVSIINLLVPTGLESPCWWAACS